MIPRTIHYCWFGRNPLPELAVSCIQSWKRYLPGYQIIEWNEDNFDIHCCLYVEEAYKAKKWAFVSDYARFWILYQHGGIYFDTDVELIRGIEDILEKGPFMGTEAGNTIAPGLGLAATPGLGLYKYIIDEYKKRHFIRNDGSYDQTTIVKFTTEILSLYGFDKSKNNDIQLVQGINIYPTEYFCPMDYYSGKISITSNTRSIHHYSESWHSGLDKVAGTIMKKAQAYGDIGINVGRVISLPIVFVDRLFTYGVKGTMKSIIRTIKKRK